MRQTISGLVAAIAVMTASAMPAMACGGGLFQSSCSPCGDPCGQTQFYQPQVYVAPVAPAYSGCNSGCGGWAHERLPDPERQYYYVNQGPTYTGPGNFAPEPTYQEEALPYRHHSYRYGYHARRYGALEAPAYGYRAHRNFHPWHTGYYHGPRMNHYGYHYGHREHALRRYY